MASLSELLALQQRPRQPNERPNALARVAEGVVHGFAGGFENRRAQEEASRKEGLDTYLKILDIQDKLARVQMQKDNMTMTRNFLKSTGLIPNDPQDMTEARSLATGTIPQVSALQPVPSTNVGKMSKMFDEFAPSVTMNKEGVSVNLRKRYPQAKVASMAQAANVARSREILAKNIYNRDHPEKQKKNDFMDRPVPYNPTSFELKQSGAYDVADKLLKGFMGDSFNQYVDETQSPDFQLKGEDFSGF